MSIMDLNEQELFRRESLSKLRELGIEPYPAPLFPINTSAAQVKAEFDEAARSEEHTSELQSPS